MKITTALLVAGISFHAFSQVPAAKTNFNSKNQRTGQWVLWFNQDWKKTQQSDSVAFYRINVHGKDRHLQFLYDRAKNNG